MLTLDDCENLFAAIRASQHEIELCTNLQALLDVYPIMSVELYRGSIFWRGRHAGIVPFDNIAQMSYPPAESTSTGRLNDAGRPCLYGATHCNTVLSELGAQVGEFYQLVGFRVKPGGMLRIGTVGELYHVYKTGYAKSLGVDPGNALSRIINSEDVEQGRRLVYIDAFFASLLADREALDKDYLFTRILSKLAYEKSGASGLFYPSIQDQTGMNIAILPEPYTSQTHVTVCQYVRISKVREFGIFDYDIILEGRDVTKDGTIHWQPPNAQNTFTLFGLTESEYNFLKSRPSDGNAIFELLKLSPYFDRRPLLVKETAPQTPILSQHSPGRNAPCTCGSGKKYKKCCGRNDGVPRK